MLLGRQVLPLLLCVFLMLVPGWARGKLFVLTGESEIRQYDLDGQDALALEVTYTGESLPGIFPLDGFDVAAGNILRCYGRNQGQKGRLLYNQFSNRLEPYAGPPREGVKILEETKIASDTDLDQDPLAGKRLRGIKIKPVQDVIKVWDQKHKVEELKQQAEAGAGRKAASLKREAREQARKVKAAAKRLQLTKMRIPSV